MATVKEDLIAGDSYKLTLNGPAAVRVFSVSGLPTSGMLAAACAEVAVQGTYPAYIGAPYPYDPNAICTEIIPSPLGKNHSTNARVTAMYAAPEISGGGGGSEIPVVKFQASVRGVTTTFRPDGTVIRVTAPQALGALGAGQQIGQINDDKAFGLLTAEWTVKTSPKWMLKYINTVNGSQWFGEPKWTWWCRDVQILPQGKNSWRVAVAIELDEELYTKVVVWRDPVTGYVPNSVPQKIDKTKIVTEQGYTVLLPKGETDFGKLPIPQNAF